MRPISCLLIDQVKREKDTEICNENLKMSFLFLKFMRKFMCSMLRKRTCNGRYQTTKFHLLNVACHVLDFMITDSWESSAIWLLKSTLAPVLRFQHIIILAAVSERHRLGPLAPLLVHVHRFLVYLETTFTRRYFTSLL